MLPCTFGSFSSCSSSFSASWIYPSFQDRSSQHQLVSCEFFPQPEHSFAPPLIIPFLAKCSQLFVPKRFLHFILTIIAKASSFFGGVSFFRICLTWANLGSYLHNEFRKREVLYYIRLKEHLIHSFLAVSSPSY